MPTVSVIVPTYNSASRGLLTIEAIRNQTFVDFECIVVDDFSTDETFQLVQQYISSDARFVIIKNSAGRNSGPRLCRSDGMRRSSGRFLAFCDSDDIWHPKKLQSQLAFMSANTAAISHTAYRRVSASSEKELGIINARRTVTFSDMLRSNWIGTSTAMIDTHWAPQLEMPSLRMRQDYAYWLMLTKLGFDSHGLDEPLVDYYVTPNSISSNKIQAAISHVHVLVKFGKPSLLKLPFLFLFYVFKAVQKRSESAKHP